MWLPRDSVQRHSTERHCANHPSAERQWQSKNAVARFIRSSVERHILLLDSFFFYISFLMLRRPFNSLAKWQIDQKDQAPIYMYIVSTKQERTGSVDKEVTTWLCRSWGWRTGYGYNDRAASGGNRRKRFWLTNWAKMFSWRQGYETVFASSLPLRTNKLSGTHICITVGDEEKSFIRLKPARRSEQELNSLKK